MSISFKNKPYTFCMKILKLFSCFLLLFSCSNSSSNNKSILKNGEGTYKPSKPYYYSEVYQKKRKADLFDFNKELALLYDLSEKDKNSAIYKAKELIKNYTLTLDTTKSIESKNKIDYYSNFIGDLHYFIGETYYQYNELDESIKEFEFETGQFNEIPKACIYIKQKKFEKAYSSLDSLTFRYYLYDFMFANYYETIGGKQKALEKYQSLLSGNWIDNGNYENLYKRTKDRIIELNKPNPILLKELYFPTINPKKIKDNL